MVFHEKQVKYNPETIVRDTPAEIESFASGAAQSDDIAMISSRDNRSDNPRDIRNE